jgi:hypothetical protein
VSFNDFDEVPDDEFEAPDLCPDGCPHHAYGFFRGCAECVDRIAPVLRWLLRQAGIDAKERHPLRGESR